MPDIAQLIQSGSANLWVFIPAAILLGGLHGLEPGHSKSMMAAFIVAVRGTVAQAVLLGLSATVSHTAVVWAIALAGLYLGSRWNTETVEPYLQLASGAIMIAIAVWMVVRTSRAARGTGHDHSHGDGHDHGHSHGPAANAAVAGRTDPTAAVVDADEEEDAHARAHAEDIRRRFTNQNVTTGQIVLFGLTGGLIPCPASVTVLLLCLQLKKVALGALLVLCFSVGLAVTLVGVGAAAALSVRHASTRLPHFDAIAKRAPLISGAVIGFAGLYSGYLGWVGLMVHRG